GVKGAAAGALGGGLSAAFGGTGALGRMAGGGINGYLQTGRADGALRGFAAGAVPADLGFGDVYLKNQYANLTIGLVRDGLRGMISADSRRGFWPGVAYGQVTNGIGH